MRLFFRPFLDEPSDLRRAQTTLTPPRSALPLGSSKNLGGELVSLANTIAVKLYSSPPESGGVRGGLNRHSSLDSSKDK